MMKWRVKSEGGNNKKIISVIAVLLAFLLTALTVYAAFLSAGHRKGVAVANGYYFTSNVLSSMMVNSDAPDYVCVETSETTSLSVQIRNYDSRLVPDPFEVAFRLSYQLINMPQTNDYTYTINCNGVQRTITQTEGTFEGLTLTASQLSAESFEVSFIRDENAISNPQNSAEIRLIATPVSPLAMTSYIIGADISLTGSAAEFHAEGSFDEAVNGVVPNSQNFAGFLYHVTTSGTIPAGETAQITLTWDNQILELSNLNEYITSDNYTVTNTTNEDGSISSTATITITVDTGEYLSFAFYRGSSEDWTASGIPITNSLISLTSVVSDT